MKKVMDRKFALGLASYPSTKKKKLFKPSQTEKRIVGQIAPVSFRRKGMGKR